MSRVRIKLLSSISDEEPSDRAVSLVITRTASQTTRWGRAKVVALADKTTKTFPGTGVLVAAGEDADETAQRAMRASGSCRSVVLVLKSKPRKASGAARLIERITKSGKSVTVLTIKAKGQRSYLDLAPGGEAKAHSNGNFALHAGPKAPSVPRALVKPRPTAAPSTPRPKTGALES